MRLITPPLLSVEIIPDTLTFLHREVRGNSFPSGIEWLSLEERFTFYGRGIGQIGADKVQVPMVVAEP